MSHRLGKRERAMLAAKAMMRQSVICSNMSAGLKSDADGRSLRKTLAYSPPVERLTIYGLARVIHNATGSEPVKTLNCKRFAVK